MRRRGAQASRNGGCADESETREFLGEDWRLEMRLEILDARGGWRTFDSLLTCLTGSSGLRLEKNMSTLGADSRCSGTLCSSFSFAMVDSICEMSMYMFSICWEDARRCRIRPLLTQKGASEGIAFGSSGVSLLSHGESKTSFSAVLGDWVGSTLRLPDPENCSPETSPSSTSPGPSKYETPWRQSFIIRTPLRSSSVPSKMLAMASDSMFFLPRSTVDLILFWQSSKRRSSCALGILGQIALSLYMSTLSSLCSLLQLYSLPRISWCVVHVDSDCSW
mmetsp:Transcript_30223/g.86351  ORF Transcript_30223/g.86351 Transcript_30223/m.86351 type:complete len:278 (-) Transcript_30223:2506-3339(-)